MVNTDTVNNVVIKDGLQVGGHKELRAKKKLSVFFAGLVLGALLVVGFVYYKYPQIFSFRTPEEQAQLAAQATVKQVARLMILPTNEEPSVLDITDPQSLIAQQQFFAGSIAGDKLLVYKAAARAIIYSPSRNIIINVGPVTSGQPSVPETQTQTVVPTTKKR